jgi:hypothetical protein
VRELGGRRHAQGDVVLEDLVRGRPSEVLENDVSVGVAGVAEAQAVVLVADEFVGGPVGGLAGLVAVGDHPAAAAVLEVVRAGLGGVAVHALSGGHGVEVGGSQWLVVVVLWWWLWVGGRWVWEEVLDRVQVKK